MKPKILIIQMKNRNVIFALSAISAKITKKNTNQQSYTVVVSGGAQ